MEKRDTKTGMRSNEVNVRKLNDKQNVECRGILARVYTGCPRYACRRAISLAREKEIDDNWKFGRRIKRGKLEN